MSCSSPLGQRTCKFREPLFVGYREQCARDRHGRRYSASPMVRSFLRSVVRVMPRITAAWLWLPSA